VREVIRRLQQEYGLATAATPPAGGGAALAEEPGTLRLNDRVVSLALIGERLAGIRRLCVPAGAVVTPAVRDELRRRQIELTYAAAADAAGARRLLLVGAADGGYDRPAALRAIAAEAGGAEELGSRGLEPLVRDLAQRIAASTKPAVLLTDQPLAAVCLANRQRGVRAVWGESLRTVDRAADSLGANLLVLDPAAQGVAELRSLVRRFLQGSHDCPAPWTAALAEG
jgi:hypothetical protein